MKIICVGKNYQKHIQEMKGERPASPVLFLKPDSAIILKNNPFIIPKFSTEVHYELELIIKIKKVGRYIDPPFAHTYYDQVGLGIDFTARDIQADCKAKGLPWEKAKAFDGSAFVGDFVDKSSLGDVQNLDFRLYKNETLVQDGNTSDMLYKIDELICYISTFFTLKIGDIIFTGTPEGVGAVAPRDVLRGELADKTSFSLDVR